jgi:hypothetical protein
MTDFNDLLMLLIPLEQARQPIMLSRLPDVRLPSPDRF